MQGSIRLYRSFLDWEWWNDHNTSRVFLYLLLNANWKDTRYRGYDIPKGSLVVGRKAMAKRLGLSEQSVRTSLEHLKSTNEITTKSTNKFTIVTIVNWEKYQCDDEEPTTKSTNEPTNDQPTTNQQLTTPKERNKLKETKIDKSILSKKVLEDAKTIIDYLNLRTGKNFRHTTSATQRAISGRLSEGYTIEDFKAVIDNKVADWKDSDMEQYLRPDTLFSPSKFESYLNQNGKPKPQKAGISESLKAIMNNSYLKICEYWQKNHGTTLTKDDAIYFRDKMLSLGDEDRIKFFVEKFRRNADQDEIADFKEFTDKWLSENGNL